VLCGEGIIMLFEVDSEKFVFFLLVKCNFMLALVCVNRKYRMSEGIHVVGKQLISHIGIL